jgi:tetratricopeptide (TPR) repeat protein
MKKTVNAMLAMVGLPLVAAAHLLPPPAIRIIDQRADEKPVEIATSSEVVESNGLCHRVRTSFTFTNPNSRSMSCDLEFPLPEGATVCGYALEVNGVMVPGVITEKEKARVAFESEKARNVDPGVVEHVAGNVWRTRIFPLVKETPRRAQVDYIELVEEGDALQVCERDGDDVFVGVRAAEPCEPTVSARIASFDRGAIIWDASSSAESKAAEWRKRLECLPEKGEWTLIAFSNETESRRFASREELLAAVGMLVYDGGTDITCAFDAAKSGEPVLFFSDELDTLGVYAPDYERLPNVIIASRGERPCGNITVRRLALGEATPAGVEVREGTLLATAWAAERVKALSDQAESRKAEFLELGRRYGVASGVTSLIVLESLDQYLRHKIEPPKEMGFHDEWVKRRASEDDQIARREADAEHERELLRLWKERVEWWLDPIPPKRTPKSGLFDGVRALSRNAAAADSEEMSEEMEEQAEPVLAMGLAAEPVENSMRAAPMLSKSIGAALGAAGSGGATITVAAWDPKAPYLDAIAKAENPYAEYLVQKKEFGSAPAFYMDCASWFFKSDRMYSAVARRVLSNMAEFGLEDAAVWRSMGWRLREAGEYEAAIRCFAKALRLRGEEGQSRRDLALVLSEHGKRLAEKDDPEAALCLNEAMALLKEAAFTNFARRSGRRGNDRQVSVVSLEELNALIAWCEAKNLDVAVPALDSAFRRDLPLRLRIVLSWDADETDIDLHVLEPDGEEAYYGHRRTSTGGFVSEDVTTGYGPEEYLRKEGLGRFKVLTNYYASHQTALTGAATATATVYTDWGTGAEEMRILTLRLDRPKDKLLIGEVDLGQ